MSEHRFCIACGCKKILEKVEEYFCRHHENILCYKTKKDLIKKEKNWEFQRKQNEILKTQKQIDYEFINSVEFDVMDDNQRIIQLRHILSKVLNDEYN